MRKELGSGDVACKSYTRFGLDYILSLIKNYICMFCAILIVLPIQCCYCLECAAAAFDD